MKEINCKGCNKLIAYNHDPREPLTKELAMKLKLTMPNNFDYCIECLRVKKNDIGQTDRKEGPNDIPRPEGGIPKEAEHQTSSPEVQGQSNGTTQG